MDISFGWRHKICTYHGVTETQTEVKLGGIILYRNNANSYFDIQVTLRRNKFL